MSVLDQLNPDYLDEAIHPIFSPADFYIDTPMIASFEETVTRWLWSGQTGGSICGDARSGKTRAAEITKTTLKSRSGESVPTFHVTISARDVKTITSILRRVAFTLGESVKDRDNADIISTKIVWRLAEEAHKISTKQVVLLVDEYQRMTLQQFEPFAELYDRLRDLRANLLTIFIGNANECSSILESITSSSYDHIRGRFFINRSFFQGISNVENVRYCLEQYDSVTQLPGSDLTTTQYFMPQAYEDGFRLSHLAEPIWSVFKENYMRSLHLTSWGMQYFIVTINTLLLDHLSKRIDTQISDRDEIIMRSIRESGIVSGQVTMENA